MRIQARSLKTYIRSALLEWLEKGKLRPGMRLEEVRLTETFGVSRTPLREALRGLEHEGLVESITNHGFRVPSLSEKVVRELYPIIGALEGLALKLGGVPDRQQILALKSLNIQMSAPGLTTHKRYLFDKRWHEKLVEHNPNQELKTELTRMKRRVMFYNGAWERGLEAIEQSCTQHDRVCFQLESGDLQSAIDAIDQHYRDGIEVVTTWLKSRQISK
jgi:DNA-binding GntR family transcriptional regulator